MRSIPLDLKSGDVSHSSHEMNDRNHKPRSLSYIVCFRVYSGCDEKFKLWVFRHPHGKQNVQQNEKRIFVTTMRQVMEIAVPISASGNQEEKNKITQN